MALKVNDRVQETSTTVGTGSLTLIGAVTGFQTFLSGIGSGNTTYYCVTDNTNWEVGIGTYTTSTLARTTVITSSNSNSLVSFSAGTKYVFSTFPASVASKIGNAIAVQSVQTTNFTATAGNVYPVNTTSAGITVTLPSSASVGDSIQIIDYAGTFATNKVTVATNGLKINGSTNNAFLNTNRETIILTYIDSTQGWVVTCDSQVTLPSGYSADFLVVAGGGGNAVNQGSNREAGSGAGGLRTSYGSTSGGGASAESQLTFILGVTYTITVGAGGSGHSNGGNSQLSGTGIPTITSLGGGSGGNQDSPGNATSGGSGGGGWYVNAGGSGTANQGYAGGPGSGSSPYGGAGGGAGGVGGSDTTVGPGLAVSITGSSVTYATGGVSNNFPSTTRNTNGPANSGNGAGGAANGGSGVVILRVPASNYSGTTTGAPTVTTDGSYKVITFTGSGTYTG